MAKKQSLQILSVQAENFQRLSAVRIDPESGLNIIAGDNEQGKSSTLDAIQLLLCGKAAMNPEAVRRGSRKATLTAEIGVAGEAPRFTVERVITQSGVKLKVTPRDGELPAGGPQGFLSSLTNSIAFDPFEFISMDSGKQADLLRKIAKIDTSSIDAEVKEKYEQRTTVNREIKSLEAQLAAFPIVAGAPTERVDTAALMEELRIANLSVRKNENKRQELYAARLVETERKSTIEENEREVIRLERCLERARETVGIAKLELTLLQENITDLVAEVDALMNPEVDTIEERIESASDKNALLEKKTRRAAIADGLEEKQKKAELLTEELTGLAEEKSNLLAAGEFPVEGLGIDSDSIVTFDGLPLCQASTSQKIRVSMAIAASLNPELRVVLIRNGNDVDRKKLKVIAATAQEMGLQVIMERIDPGQGIPCFIIEDGTVVSVEKASDSDG